MKDNVFADLRHSDTVAVQCYTINATLSVMEPFNAYRAQRTVYF